MVAATPAAFRGRCLASAGALVSAAFAVRCEPADDVYQARVHVVLAQDEERVA